MEKSTCAGTVESCLRLEEENIIKNLAALRDAREMMIGMGGLLDAVGVSPEAIYFCGHYLISIGECWAKKCISQNQARAITTALLQAFPEIEKFEKHFDGCETEPVWYWRAIVNGITLKIYGAPGDENCTPVRHYSDPISSWVCETKGE